MPFTAEQIKWREFLNKYKSLTCLWLKSKKNSYTKAECDAAWEELIDKAKEISEDADKSLVQKRINNCRTVYLREIKKVKQAQKAGKKYIPTCFYFDILKSIYDDLEELKQDDSDSNAGSIVTDSFNNDITPVTIKKELHCVNIEEEESTIELPTKRVSNNPARILARRMAEHLEQMDADQALIAEKIISDICVFGRLQQLNMESSIVLK